MAEDEDEDSPFEQIELDAGELAGLRADVALARYLSGRFTRRQIQLAIQEGGATIAGRAIKPATVLKPGVRVVLRMPQATGPVLPPEDIPLAIVYEDEELVVIDKPPRLVVHPSRGHRGGTLANALVFHFAALSDPGDPLRPGILHRLDRDTSGVIAVAKDTQSHWRLARQWEDRTVAKTYLCLVEGQPPLDHDAIDLAIARHPVAREKMAIDPAGRSACTRYRVLRRYARHALVECHPETGRTHQIRVHMRAIGCPILCDALYSARAAVGAAELCAGEPSEPAVLDRQALHARSLALDHPRTGERMRFEAPIPPDIQGAIDLLERGACFRS